TIFEQEPSRSKCPLKQWPLYRLLPFRHPKTIIKKVKKKMKRLAALIASAGCALMGLCDFALSREYE
ncbi:hypothetical protein HID58_048294, partial [Brassica napus]